mmetsp:Transcript_80004/g.221202  ORF Transcript_80004/g.221202 Transcript_80004/m.221202 type:complete len:360 (-) Transcript_80004:1540-2619(-)
MESKGVGNMGMLLSVSIPTPGGLLGIDIRACASESGSFCSRLDMSTRAVAGGLEPVTGISTRAAAGVLEPEASASTRAAAGGLEPVAGVQGAGSSGKLSTRAAAGGLAPAGVRGAGIPTASSTLAATGGLMPVAGVRGAGTSGAPSTRAGAGVRGAGTPGIPAGVRGAGTLCVLAGVQGAGTLERALACLGTGGLAPVAGVQGADTPGAPSAPTAATSGLALTADVLAEGTVVTLASCGGAVPRNLLAFGSSEMPTIACFGGGAPRNLCRCTSAGVTSAENSCRTGDIGAAMLLGAGVIGAWLGAGVRGTAAPIFPMPTPGAGVLGAAVKTSSLYLGPSSSVCRASGCSTTSSATLAWS